ncbi:MAG: glycosyltransferase [Cetobacterium sp.]|uniref:glycosyltransferase n=1 Tax=Cetobacterium sp. TaxID=2071632 RepID=UPI003EE4F2E2
MKTLVSVLICVYNEEVCYIKEALESIKNQTYKNLEIIIVFDGYKESIYNYLIQEEKKNNKIKIIKNSENLGLTKSLNIGLMKCTGKYIARMDADDISHEKRIEKQVFFMEKNNNIDILGCGTISFGEKVLYMSPIEDMNDQEIKCNLFFTSTLCHPSIMIRRESIDKNKLYYDEKFLKTQDYDLWERASLNSNLAFLKDLLLFYRIHKSQITTLNKTDQTKYTEIIMKRRLKRLGLEFNCEEFECHLTLKGVSNISTTKECEEWIKKIINASKNKKIINYIQMSFLLDKKLCLLKLKRKEQLKWSEIPIAVKIIYSKLKIVLCTKIIQYRKGIKKC